MLSHGSNETRLKTSTLEGSTEQRCIVVQLSNSLPDVLYLGFGQCQVSSAALWASMIDNAPKDSTMLENHVSLLTQWSLKYYTENMIPCVGDTIKISSTI